MPQQRIETPGSEAMQNIAGHYANELDAQFRTLNHFVSQGGEIGRAHETFLRGILKRFLPTDIRVSSGFIASPKWTSRQQDILLHSEKYPVLFEVGDCTVIDHETFVGAIEVKTDLDSSSRFLESIEIQAELRDQMVSQGLYAVYAWDGIKHNTALEVLWKFVRQNPMKNFEITPDVIFVRGQYFLMANRESDRPSVPYRLWIVEKDGINEGQALLGLVASVWRFGLSKSRWPWWLLSWHKDLGVAAGKYREIPWPNDLRIAIADSIRKRKA